MGRLLIDRVEFHPGAVNPERQEQPGDRQRAAVRYCNAPTDSGGSQLLPTFEELADLLGGALREAQQPHQLIEDSVLRTGVEVEAYRPGAEKVTESHRGHNCRLSQAPVEPRTPLFRRGGMPRVTLISRFVVLATVAGSCGSSQGPLGPPDPEATAALPIALAGVTVLTMGPAGVLLGQTIVIREGRIVALGPRADVSIPGDAVVIEGRGRVAMPGLADMHVHNVTRDLPLLVGFGITTVRAMWGVPSVLQLRDSIASGLIRGPRIYSASSGLDARPGQWPLTQFADSPEEARAAAGRMAEQGWTWIKVYSSLSRVAYDAIADEAGRLGFRLVGHVPHAVPVEHALALGQLSIEHLMGYDRSLTGSEGVAAWASADDREFPPLISATVAAGTWNAPTLAILRKINGGAAVMMRGYAAKARFVKALHQAGGRLLVGTDSGIDIVFAGAALADELQEFVDAGIPIATVLRIATRDAAEFLGAATESGTIEVGKRADLLLLDQDPRIMLRTLTDPSGLLLGGNWLPRERLAQLRAGSRQPLLP